MKTIIRLLYILSILFSTHQVSAQQTDIKRSNNKVYLNGKPYFIHIVRNGETLFAISQAYQIPIDSIKKDNLHVSDSLKINQYLKIRINKPQENTKQKFVYHQVKKGDTPFNLAMKYKVTIDDIYTHNPNAKIGISINEVLKIPLVEEKGETQTQIAPVKIVPEIEDYIVYTVQKKETLYGIAAKFGTTQEQIRELNPELKERPLQIGEELKIPASNGDLAEDKDYYFHKVRKQETIYGITKQYNIKDKQLYKANPDLKDRQIQEGELLRIPKNITADSIFAEKSLKDTVKYQPERPIYSVWKDTLILPPCPIKDIDTLTTYKVAFFLPFNLNINDTLGKYIDVVRKDPNGVEIIETIPRQGNIEDRIYSKSKIFIEFYQGALIALNDLKEMGISLDVHVFDTQDDSANVVKILKTNNLKDFDLFIGPIYSELLTLVGDYAWEHSINIVSPLSLKNDFIEHNPYAFQVSPPFEIQMHHASDFLNEFDIKNYIVIHDGNNQDQEYISLFKKQLFAQMNDKNFDQIKYNEVFYYDARDSVLKEVFTKGMKNIVIVPSSDQAFITDVMGKLNGYSYEYDITVFGQPRWLRYENIELDNFHNTNTHIFSNSFIDYNNTQVNRFVKQYRYFYKGEPDRYAFQGYDITKYFCLALNKYGKDFRKCIHTHNIDLLQTQFHFVPFTDQGGYQNTAIYILEYTKDYQLRKAAQYPK